MHAAFQMNLRDEAMLMLEKRGGVLDTAVKVSAVLKEARIDAAVRGGVAVGLHGHVRTTMDVDMFVRDPLEACRRALEARDIRFNAQSRVCVRWCSSSSGDERNASAGAGEFRGARRRHDIEAGGPD
jgi:predicted nucleotidyltransferase